MRIDELKQITHADVYKKGVFAGVLSRTARGCKFEYDKDFLAQNTEGISYQMPIAQESYVISGVNLPPFFAGLLPEGLRLTTLIEKIKTSTDDLMSLLLVTGADCIGDVSVLPSGERSKAKPKTAPTEMDTEDLECMDFYDLFKNSLGIDGKNNLMHEPAIPGVQEKISIRRMSLPIKFTKRTHKSFILKLNPPSKPLMIENEAFFLNMAKACGLDVNKASVIRDKNKNAGLLVERFDRIYDPKTKKNLQIHQEDACQFLNKYPADKYRIPYADIARGIEKYSSASILELASLLKLIAFSYIIGNGDLHAKNISLRTHPTTERVELTPAYDILSTLPYGDRKMALKLDSKDDSLNRKLFIAFGLRFGIREAATVAIINELCSKAKPWISKVPEIGFPARQTADIQRTMKLRINELSG